MPRTRIEYAVSMLMLCLVWTSCGGSSNRTLLSISIRPNPATAKNGTVQLTATGTFSLPPITVSPLAVDWSQSPCDNLCNVVPAVVGPIGVSATGLASCAQGYSGTGTVHAVAPANPNLPQTRRTCPWLPALPA